MQPMTWGDIKLRALQTMFSNEGKTINVEDSNQDYVYAMPGKANEAMHQLATVGRPILKQFTIQIKPAAEEQVTENSLTIPETEQHYKLTLTDYMPRFRAIDRIMLECGGVYGETDGWELEGDDVLLIPGAAGVYTIWYKAYPQTITQDTLDSEPIDMPAEAAALIPLYIAGELYKEDELAMATVFRNEFEDGLEKLRQAYRESGAGFRSGYVRNTTGWW